MSWAKLDDRFHGNRKIRRAWKRCRASVGLYVLALTYAAQHETDGMVDAEFIDDLMPAKRERDTAVDALTEIGLWEAAGDNYRIHDYLEYQHSAADAEAKRLAKSKRQAEWRARQASSASTDVSTNGHVDDAVDPAPTRPDQSRPDPTEPPQPPEQARGEQGPTGNASLRANSRALGTNPRAADQRHLTAVAAERCSLAVASLTEPNDEQRADWERLKTALHGSTSEQTQIMLVEPLRLAAVYGSTLVIDGPNEAMMFAPTRLKKVLAERCVDLGVEARFVTPDEHNGLSGEAA